jgi:hypothetical protein
VTDEHDVEYWSSKREVEAMEPSVSIRVVYDDDDNINEAVRDEIVAATESILDAMGCDVPGGGILHPLRLIIITDLVHDAVRHWWRELYGSGSVKSQDDGGTTITGRCYLWGNWKSERIFSVVIARSRHGDESKLNLNAYQRVLIHELAHVYIEPIVQKGLGPKSGRTQDRWYRLQLEEAAACFGEYYAEHVVAHYADEDEVGRSVDLLVKLVSEAQIRIQNQVAVFNDDNDSDTLMDVSYDVISSSILHMGRVLGLHHGRDLPADLTTRLDATSPRLVGHLDELRVAL